MKRTLLMAILLVVVAGGVSMAQAGVEVGLRSRVLLYHSHLEHGQYGEMWEISSKRLHDGNDNDKEEFVRYLRRHHLAKVRTRFLSLRLNGVVAKVKVEIRLWDVKENRWFSEKQEETWVLENGDWYFDTHSVVEESDTN